MKASLRKFAWLCAVPEIHKECFNSAYLIGTACCQQILGMLLNKIQECKMYVKDKSIKSCQNNSISVNK